MKIAIISDCHFGFNEDALPQAREALEKAMELKADAILMPGDIYDYRVPKQETVHETMNLFAELQRKTSGKHADVKISEENEGTGNPLSHEGIPVLAIWGTHERRSKGLSNIIQILEAANMVVSVHAKKIILKKEGESVCIQGLGGVPEEYFRRTLEVAAFKPLKGAFNIFVFHQNLKELLPIEREEDVAMEELPAGFDLYVNGHIHWNQELKINGRRLLVAGSTIVTQMKKNEEKPKGFYLFDTKTGKAEFERIEGRPFFFRELEFQNPTAKEVEERVDKELQELLKAHCIKKPVIKIKLTGNLRKADGAVLELEKIIRKHSGRAQIFLDRDFESDDLKEKIDTIRKQKLQMSQRNNWPLSSLIGLDNNLPIRP
ncbi:MAG: metallophosphoesterase family protein [Candidatus Micrarchaeota archaeon]